MADKEYGEEYAIYVSKDGLRFVTNPSSMQIMEMLERSDLTATEIADRMGLSKSTIQSNMTKLSRWDLVSSYTINDDKRKIYYRTISQLIIKSVDTDYAAEEIEKNIMERVIDTGHDYDSSIIGLCNIIPLRMGIDMSPFLERAGMLVASYVRNQFRGKDLNEVLSDAANLVSSAGFPEVKMYFEGADLIIDQKCQFNIPNEYLISSYFLAGFMRKLMQVTTKKQHYIYSISTNDGITKIVIRPIVIDNNSEGPKDLPLSITRNDWPFAIYHVNGKSILFGNPTQMKILECITKDGVFLKDVSEKTGIPMVTVHVNINKLLETGVIVSDESVTSRFSAFKLVGMPVVFTTTPRYNPIEKIVPFFMSLTGDYKQYRVAAMKYMVYSFNGAGIDFSGIMRFAGQDFARTSISRKADIEPEQYLRNIEEFTYNSRMRVKFESYIPLKMSLQGPDVDEMGENTTIAFFEGMVCEGLKILTGMDYPLSISIVKN